MRRFKKVVVWKESSDFPIGYFFVVGFLIFLFFSYNFIIHKDIYIIIWFGIWVLWRIFVIFQHRQVYYEEVK